MSQPLLDVQKQLQEEQASRPHEDCMTASATDMDCLSLSYNKESTHSTLHQTASAGRTPQADHAVPAQSVPVQAPAWMDSAQLHQQTVGWEKALAAVQHHMAAHGPYHGLLGFSQGAAVAAAVAASVCAQQRRRSQPVSTVACDKVMPGHVAPPLSAAAKSAARVSGIGEAVTPTEGCDTALCGSLTGQPDPMGCELRCVVLCSGYIPGCPEVQQVLHPQQPVAIPSCHVYSVSGADQQVPTALSQQLAGCFAAEGRVVVEHDAGHLIPSAQQVVQQIKAFLEHVLVK